MEWFERRFGGSSRAGTPTAAAAAAGAGGRNDRPTDYDRHYGGRTSIFAVDHSNRREDPTTPASARSSATVHLPFFDPKLFPCMPAEFRFPKSSHSFPTATSAKAGVEAAAAAKAAAGGGGGGAFAAAAKMEVGAMGERSERCESDGSGDDTVATERLFSSGGGEGKYPYTAGFNTSGGGGDDATTSPSRTAPTRHSQPESDWMQMQIKELVGLSDLNEQIFRGGGGGGGGGEGGEEGGEEGNKRRRVTLGDRVKRQEEQPSAPAAKAAADAGATMDSTTTTTTLGTTGTIEMMTMKTTSMLQDVFSAKKTKKDDNALAKKKTSLSSFLFSRGA